MPPKQSGTRAKHASISQSTNKREDNPEPKGAIFSKKVEPVIRMSPEHISVDIFYSIYFPNLIWAGR